MPSPGYGGGHTLGSPPVRIIYYVKFLLPNHWLCCELCTSDFVNVSVIKLLLPFGNKLMVEREEEYLALVDLVVGQALVVTGDKFVADKAWRSDKQVCNMGQELPHLHLDIPTCNVPREFLVPNEVNSIMN